MSTRNPRAQARVPCPRSGALRFTFAVGAEPSGQAGGHALRIPRFALIKGNIPSLLGYNVNVSGGDLVSTWVTKPSGHAEVPISS